jgi:glycosyltransferase involved in cell wall biosynthesis
MNPPERISKPTLLVLASTYPRWANDHEPGFVHELCHRLSDEFDVVSLVPDAPNAQPDGFLDGVEVLRYRYAPRGMQTLVYDGGITANLRRSAWKWLLVPAFVLGQYVAARRLMKHRRIDAIHAHWLIPQGLIARNLGRRFACPYLVTSHGGDLFGLRGRLLTKLKSRVAADSSAMTVVSNAMREEAVRLGLLPPTLDVLPMGVDLRTRFIVAPDVVRSDNEIVFVGRLVRKKGLPHLLDALPAILEQLPDTRLTIVGFGPEEKALRDQAQRLGIEQHVDFVGPMAQHRLPEIYQRASVFVAPFVREGNGDQEGLPVVVMEAIGCGCPVVVGDVAGIEDLLGEMFRHVTVDAKNTGALAAAVLDTLANPSIARARALMIREAAVKRIDWSQITKRYAALIHDCIKRFDRDHAVTRSADRH